MLRTLLACLVFGILAGASAVVGAENPKQSAPTTRASDASLRLKWEENILTISGRALPGGELKVLYLEAYCRAGSTDRKWDETVIGHKTRLVSASPDGREIRLQCTLKDGVVVDHEITAGADDVDFRLVVTNPTDKASAADWAQPCLRVDAFTGKDKDTYLEKCFIFEHGKLARMPTERWATKALYTPGQVWAAKGVKRSDVNPRPLNEGTPDNALIGCFSADEKMMLAVAFEPCQELFQGVYACLHSDFRIGGLAPAESKKIHGKIYVMPADAEALIARYERDFPHGARP